MKICPSCEEASVSLPRAIFANYVLPARCPRCGALSVPAVRWWALLLSVAIFVPLFAALELIERSWLHFSAGLSAAFAFLAIYALAVPLRRIERADVVATRWLLAVLFGLLAASRVAIHFGGGGA